MEKPKKKSDSVCDAWFFPERSPVAVVLLTHGMNLRPTRMDDLAAKLVAGGFAVYRPVFTGHCGDNKKYLTVTAADWERDAGRFHAEAERKAAEHGVPLHLFAYSFSALVYEALGLSFARKVYLAPALALKPWFPLAAFVAGAFPWLRYYSWNLRDYLANVQSGLASVAALAEFHRRLPKGPAPAHPTLIWIDRGDELVSYGGVEAWAEGREGCVFRPIEKSERRPLRAWRHLIVDEATLGKRAWEKVTSESLAFLSPS